MPAEPFDDLDPLPDRRAEVSGAGDGIAVEQVVGADFDPEQCPAERALGGQAVVDPLEQHGMIVDRHPRHPKPVAGVLRLRGHLAWVIEVGLDPDLAGGAEQRDQFVVEPLRQRDGDPSADPDNVEMGDRRQVLDEERELLQRECQRIAPRDDHVVDLGVIADILDHPPVVVRDGPPAAALHRGALARAEPAIHGADMCCHEQRAVGVAVRQAGDGRVLVLIERVILAVGPDSAGQFEWRGDRLEPDRVVRFGGVNQGEVVGRDGELVLRLKCLDGATFVFGEGEQIDELPGVPDGVL